MITADDCIQRAVDALRGTSFVSVDEQARAVRAVALAINQAYFDGADSGAAELQAELQEFIATDPRIHAGLESILKEHAAQVLKVYGIEVPN